MDMIFDVDPADKMKYQGWCILNPKYKTFMVYGGYDKAQRWKAVGAFNSKDDQGTWHAVAKNIEILKAMAKIRGAIALDKAASARFKELNASLEGSRAGDADIDIPCPHGLSYLPFQKAGIKYCLDKVAAGQKGILIGDDMGLGKTIQALGFINAKPEIHRAIIVCPASLKLNWLREAQKWLVGDWKFWVANDKEGPKADDSFLIINYERLDKYPELLTMKFDVVAFDESQKLKNGKAKRTQLAYGSWDKEKKVRILGLIDRSTYRLCLSGTPILNRPVELWSTISALAPGSFGSFTSFADKFCGAYTDKWAYHTDGASNLDELQLKLRTKFMVRRLKKDVLTELPPKIRQIIEIAPPGCASAVAAEQVKWKKHEEALEDIRTSMDLAKAAGNRSEYDNAVGKLREASTLAFTEMSAERHKVAVVKAPYVAEHVFNVLENVDKIFVVVHHLDVGKILAEELKEFNPVMITGETPVNLRQGIVDAFQTDPNIRVIIGNIQAAGVGLTLTAAHVAVFAELDFVPANVSQCEDRLHRIGQNDTVLIHHVVIDGSFDSILAKTLVEKQRIIDAALDDSTELKIPVIPTPKGQQLSWKVPVVPPEQKAIILAGLKQIASFCDGARAIDGNGFNKLDTRKGKALAALIGLTDGQAMLGAFLVNKYRKQIGGEEGEFGKIAKQVIALQGKAA